MARSWAKNARSLAALFQKVNDLLKAENAMPVKNAGAQHRSASENTKCHEMVFGPDA